MTDHTKACPPQDSEPPIPIGYEPGGELPQEVVFPNPIVKLEDHELAKGELDTLMTLVAYSSSPPPLIQDRPESSVGIGGATAPHNVHILRSKYLRALHGCDLTLW
jgi:hypothetical protein